MSFSFLSTSLCTLHLKIRSNSSKDENSTCNCYLRIKLQETKTKPVPIVGPWRLSSSTWSWYTKEDTFTTSGTGHLGLRLFPCCLSHPQTPGMPASLWCCSVAAAPGWRVCFPVYRTQGQESILSLSNPLGFLGNQRWFSAVLRILLPVHRFPSHLW